MARTKDQPQLPVFTTVETVYKPNEPIIALINQVAGALGEGVPVFIQDTAPVTTSAKWAWMHWDAYGNWILEIEDGKPGYTLFQNCSSTFSTPDYVSLTQTVPVVTLADVSGVSDSVSGALNPITGTWNGYPSGSLVPSSTLTPYASGTTGTWNGYPSGSLVPSSTLTPYASGTSGTWNGYPSGSLVPSSTLTPYASGGSSFTNTFTDPAGVSDAASGTLTTSTWNGYPSGSLVPSSTLTPYASGTSSNLTASVTDVSGIADTATGVTTWAGYPSGSLVPSPTLAPV